MDIVSPTGRVVEAHQSSGVLTFNLITGLLEGASERACEILQVSNRQIMQKPCTIEELLGIALQSISYVKSWESSVTPPGAEPVRVRIRFQKLHTSSHQQLVCLVDELVESLQPEVNSDFLLASFNAADDLIALMDPDTLEIRHMNQGGAEALGYTTAELLGRKPTHFKPLLSEEHYRSCFVLPLLDGQQTTMTFETIHRRKDGSEYPVEVLLQPVKDNDGRLILLNIARDLSDRKLRDQEQDRFFSVALQMLCIVDPSGYFLRVNSHFTKTLGYSREELKSRPFEHFIHPDDIERTQEATVEVLEGAKLLDFENRYRCSDGSYRTLQWAALKDPISGHLYAAARDVTEERERELQLSESNRRLELTGRFDRAARRILAIFNERRDLEVVLADVCLAMTEELKFSDVAFRYLDEPGGHPEAPDSEYGEKNLAHQALTAQRAVFQGHEFAIPLIHQREVLAVLEGSSLPELDELEQFALLQLTCQLAVSLYALNQFKQLHTLSGELSERGREIERQNQELKKANRLKSEFLANMSHELRTPLNAIIGFSECLKDGILGELSESQVDYVTEIFQSGEHLLSLINDILDLSKVEAGMMELHLQETDVRHLLSNSLSIIKEQALKKSLTIEQTLSDNLRPVTVDPRKLRQVVYNLLSNAVKFTDPGGRIGLTACIAEGELVVEVSDSGIGIEAEDQHRLFEPFVQLDSDLDRRYEGTGLGLGLVEKLVSLLGGRVEVWSELGVGSRFTVVIPLTPEDLVGPTHSSSESVNVLVVDDGVRSVERLAQVLESNSCSVGTAFGDREALEALESHGVRIADRVSNMDSRVDPALSQQGGKAPLRVLTIEDESSERLLYELYLEDLNVEVMDAESAEQGLSMVAERRPDLIVLDIQLLQMSGFDFLDKLSEREIGNIPILVVSGTVDFFEVSRRTGADFLEKPVRREEFVHAVQCLLTQRSPA